MAITIFSDAGDTLCQSWGRSGSTIEELIRSGEPGLDQKMLLASIARSLLRLQRLQQRPPHSPPKNLHRSPVGDGMLAVLKRFQPDRSPRVLLVHEVLAEAQSLVRKMVQSDRLTGSMFGGKCMEANG